MIEKTKVPKEILEYESFVRQIPGVILTKDEPSIVGQVNIMFSKMGIIKDEGIAFIRIYVKNSAISKGYVFFSFIKKVYPSATMEDIIADIKEMYFSQSSEEGQNHLNGRFILSTALSRRENILPRLPRKFARTYLFNLEMFPDGNISSEYLFDKPNLPALEGK